MNKTTYALIIDNNLCIGCHSCTVACKSEHDIPVGVNRTWVKYVDSGCFPESTRSFSVLRCNHCSLATCVSMCPVSALYRRDDGIIDFDSDRCVGCKSCTQACPYDAIYIDPVRKTAAKCNFCSHRIDNGLLPACVVACPQKGISLVNTSDINAEISDKLNKENTIVRKPEKNTVPNIFYLNTKPGSLDAATDRKGSYIWRSQEYGVGIRKNEHIFREEKKPVSTNQSYDAPDKGIMWGWEVTGYLLTKAIAAGLILVPALLTLLGESFTPKEILITSVASLIFIILTAVLLIKDLSKPGRFLYLVFRPQMRSWLTKGTYILIAFGIMLLILIIQCISGYNKYLNITLYITSPVAVMTAIYTAFLFAQARGRELWTDKTSVAFMLLHSFILGTIAFAIIRTLPGGHFNTSLNIIHLFNLVVIFWLFRKKSQRDSLLTYEKVVRGKYSIHFWLIVALAGNIIPVLLNLISPFHLSEVISGVLLVTGIIMINYLYIKVPQLIPLR